MLSRFYQGGGTVHTRVIITLLFAVLITAACMAAGCRTADSLALSYDIGSGIWDEGSVSEPTGDEMAYDGRLFRVGASGELDDAGAANLDDLFAAGETFSRDRDDEFPTLTSWVLVLGSSERSGHYRLASVPAGEFVSHQGRIYQTRAGADGLEIRRTGDVISEVGTTFIRHASELYVATIELDDGTRISLAATSGHPFYVPDEDTYRPLRNLEPGVLLRMEGGGIATLVSVDTQKYDAEVYNFEVLDQHSYYAGDVGISVHNSKYGPRCPGWLVGKRWGRNRLIKEMYRRGWRMVGPTKAGGGFVWESATGELLRIMPKSRGRFRNSPVEKYLRDFYYRYQVDPNTPWGRHTPLPDGC